MSEIVVNHLDGEFGVTNKVKTAIDNAGREFIYIGFLLDEANNFEYFKENGYETIYDYCEDNFGFKKSSTNNFIRVYRAFGEAMYLKEPYRKFSYSQLTEMCSMSNNQLINCRPEMTVRELRAIKKGNIVYSYSDDGQLVITEDTIISKDVPIQTSGKSHFSIGHYYSLEKYSFERFSRKCDFEFVDDFKSFVLNTGADGKILLSGEGTYSYSVMCCADNIEVKFNGMLAYIDYSCAYYILKTLSSLRSTAERKIDLMFDDPDFGICSNCNHTIMADDNFCSNCGAKFV